MGEPVAEVWREVWGEGEGEGVEIGEDEGRRETEEALTGGSRAVGCEAGWREGKE